MIRKLRAGLMPPPGNSRPDEETLLGLVESLEEQMDRAAAERPNPGHRTFQRLNRAEYGASIRDLLDLEIDPGAYLPLDTKSANFDNIADAQLLSATLTDGYLRAAAEISRLAIGDPHVTPSESTYRVSRWDSQSERVEGAPYGSRGGVSVLHNFPADGYYEFRVSFHHETTGALVGNGRNALHTREGEPELLEISIDGEPAEVLEVNRWMHTSDPDGVNIRSGRVFVQAGPRQVSAAFVRRSEGPLQDLISPHDWSLASTSIAGSYGFTVLPHLRDLAIGGPYDPQGVSETPSRAAVFSCRPGPEATDAEARGCAREIVTRLGSRAYRRPLSEANVAGLMGLYGAGAVEEGFEGGVRTALEGILASPHFVFRIEEPAGGEVAGAAVAGGGGQSGASVDRPESYRIGEHDLAARLSFFLWGSGPDETLMAVAADGRLSDPAVLEAQVRRMLSDPRASALSTRFAAQWLRLQDLEKIQPDVRVNPDFDEPLKRAMLEETETFFDAPGPRKPLRPRSLHCRLHLRERAAGASLRHPRCRGRPLPARPPGGRRAARDPRPRQHADAHLARRAYLAGAEGEVGDGGAPRDAAAARRRRTSPSWRRRRWRTGDFLTVRERPEMHAASPTCNSCHRMIDPIGLALENYDVSGAWRIRDQGMPIDAASDFYDGTPISTPSELRAALLKRPEPLLRTFTENLMAYALGRRLEYYDMPAVRRIVRRAAEQDYRISAFIVGVAGSDAFLMKAAPAVVDGDPANGKGG